MVDVTCKSVDYVVIRTDWHIGTCCSDGGRYQLRGA